MFAEIPTERKLLYGFALILILACSACSSPAEPEVDYEVLTLDYETTVEDLMDDPYWFEVREDHDLVGFYAEGNWRDDPVRVDVELVLSMVGARLGTITSSAPIGCDLVVVCGTAIGDPRGAETRDGYVFRTWEPAAR